MYKCQIDRQIDRQMCIKQIYTYMYTYIPSEPRPQCKAFPVSRPARVHPLRSPIASPRRRIWSRLAARRPRPPGCFAPERRRRQKGRLLKLSIYLSIYRYIYLSIYQSIYKFIPICIDLSIYLYLSSYLSIYLQIQIWVYTYLYLYIARVWYVSS